MAPPPSAMLPLELAVGDVLAEETEALEALEAAEAVELMRELSPRRLSRPVPEQ